MLALKAQSRVTDELSDVAPKIVPMYHPWRRFRTQFPDWELSAATLADDIYGHTDSPRKEIRLAHDLLQTERRCTIEHEMHHAEAGDVGEQHPHRESAIEDAVARKLIPLELLLNTVTWAHDLEELADECWVDTSTMQCRLDGLTDAERTTVRAALAARDFHEEGM